MTASMRPSSSWTSGKGASAVTQQQARHRKAIGQASESSAGRLETFDGQRLVPSHAVKQGRRYRYYIEQRLMQDEGVGTKGLRYAAEEVEKAVLVILQRFLNSPADMLASLAMKDPSPGSLKRIVGCVGHFGLRALDRAGMGNGGPDRKRCDGGRPFLQLLEASHEAALKRESDRPRSGAGIAVSALACQNILSLSVMDILVCTVVFFVGEVILARLFYKLHFRDRPY